MKIVKNILLGFGIFLISYLAISLLSSYAIVLPAVFALLALRYRTDELFIVAIIAGLFFDFSSLSQFSYMTIFLVAEIWLLRRLNKKTINFKNIFALFGAILVCSLLYPAIGLATNGFVGGGHKFILAEVIVAALVFLASYILPADHVKE